mmetsp:Transcript_10464/g.23225  ORF Transcript_10464/g.23225 Transcript_10464/m.23225 type:complete len:603 (+) Transcript_10464:2-1810(+)
MNSLPVSIVICQNQNQAEGTPPSAAVLRVKIQSLTTDEKSKEDDTAGSECYYSAYPEESYQLDIVPPNGIYPGNYTAAGVGVCTILKPWKDTLDKITHGIMDSNVNYDDTKSKIVMDGNAQRPAPSENTNRILLCGAKGVGKSTLLRYATNRILSAQSDKNAGTSSPEQSRSSSRVAILDLDCGQPELSTPGMLSLTIVSRPLLYDPPVHMVCGGSCDHYGGKMGDAGVVGQNPSREEDYVKHDAAYFFGDITSKADPDTYIQMTSQLMRRYHELQELEKQQGNDSLPLLVNTDGWVKGLGYEILSAIIGAVNPGHIVQIMGSTKAKSFDMSSHNRGGAHDQNPHSAKLLHVVPSFDESLLSALESDDNRSRSSTNSSSSNYTLSASASDHRDHRLCAYFMGGHNTMMNMRSRIPGEMEGICFNKERGLHDPNNIIGMSLASMSPYAVPFRSVKVYPPPGLLDGIPELEPSWGVRGDLACNDVLDSLNGSIVGLCCNPDDFEMPLSSCNAGTCVPILNCVGLGIIRSIDHKHKVFFVLTPVHPRLLVNATSLVAGNFNLPTECVYRGVHSDSFPFLACGHSITNPTVGADVMKSRNHSRGKK